MVLYYFALVLRSIEQGGHYISKRLRKVIEYKRFRIGVSAFFVFLVLVASHISTTTAAPMLPITSTTLVTEEVMIETRSSSKVPVDGSVSQGFSYYHPGIDIQSTFDNPIYPFHQGMVVETGYQAGGYGNYVVVDHKNGYFSLYAHMNKVLVKNPDEVTQDSVIGTVGLTGHTTGSHLHLEVYENGAAVNPLTVLPQLNFAIPVENASGRIGGATASASHTLMLPMSQEPVITAQPVTTVKEEKQFTAALLNTFLKESAISANLK
jgi:hypothetical protein